MSISYQFYTQGSSRTLSIGTSAVSVDNILNISGINHLSVTSTVDCFVTLTQNETAVSATTANGEFILSRAQTIIPAISKKSISVIGATQSGTFYYTEYLNG